MLSIKGQIGRLFEAGFTFVIGFIMTISFSLGFLISGMSMLIILLITYPFVKKSLNMLE